MNIVGESKKKQSNRGGKAGVAVRFLQLIREEALCVELKRRSIARDSFAYAKRMADHLMRQFAR